MKNTQASKDTVIEQLQCVKNLLILNLIKEGASAEEISIALKAGQVNPSNIRIAFPMKKIKKKDER